jgi:hypothetical protein
MTGRGKIGAREFILSAQQKTKYLIDIRISLKGGFS